jgi:hypothetical protein
MPSRLTERICPLGRMCAVPPPFSETCFPGAVRFIAVLLPPAGRPLAPPGFPAVVFPGRPLFPAPGLPAFVVPGRPVVPELLPVELEPGRPLLLVVGRPFVVVLGRPFDVADGRPVELFPGRPWLALPGRPLGADECCVDAAGRLGAEAWDGALGCGAGALGVFLLFWAAANAGTTMSSASKEYFRKASSFILKFIADSSTEDFIRRQSTNLHVHAGTESFNCFFGPEGEKTDKSLRHAQWQCRHEHPGAEQRYQNPAADAIVFWNIVAQFGNGCSISRAPFARESLP